MKQVQYVQIGLWAWPVWMSQVGCSASRRLLSAAMKPPRSLWLLLRWGRVSAAAAAPADLPDTSRASTAARSVSLREGGGATAQVSVTQGGGGATAQVSVTQEGGGASTTAGSVSLREGGASTTAQVVSLREGGQHHSPGQCHSGGGRGQHHSPGLNMLVAPSGL
ncbi:hypothetical protein INR49_009477 [Caranx melampygus]|nr:hypothetical protein INR49_009477 [Caranx melampygus]